MRALFSYLGKVATTDLTVLIEGETGTGKELLAQAIHAASPRRDAPFVTLDCGALSPASAEAAFFGAPPGGPAAAPFAAAAGGTILLDEIGELPAEVQPRLLRALSDRRLHAAGVAGALVSDVRVIASTRRPLAQAVASEAFRSDLYFRIAQIVVEIPPLRARLEDTPILVRELLASLGAPGALRRVSPGTFERLLRHDWPGNVRELRNAVAVGLALASEGGPIEIKPHAMHRGEPAPPSTRPSEPAPSGNYHEAKKTMLERFEREYFAALAARDRDNISAMARRSGLDRNHVRKYLIRHGLIESSDNE
jgi:DNA-binding NtrC family response regulator